MGSPYTFLQVLGCRHEQSAAVGILAGLCFCPHLAEGEHVKGWCRATLRGASIQSSPSHQKAAGAVNSSVVSHRRVLCAHRERKAIWCPQHKPQLYSSQPAQLPPAYRYGWIISNARRQLPAQWDGSSWEPHQACLTPENKTAGQPWP